MKKLIIILSMLLALVGCDMGTMNNTPTKQVEMFFARYQTLDNDVLEDLDNVVKEELTFNTTQREKYRDLMKKHYQGIKYDIKEEKIDGDKATVTVEIEVNDYSKMLKDVNAYLNKHPEKFQNDKGEYDEDKFGTYRLEEMEKVKERVKYTMEMKLKKKDNKWKLDKLTDEQMDKIHGVYKY